MATVGTVAITVTASTSEFTRAMDETKKKLESVERGSGSLKVTATSTFSAFGKGAGFGAAKLAALGAAAGGAILGILALRSAMSAVTGLFKTTIVNSVKLAAEFEQTKVSFETMLGSADAAAKTLGDLNKFSAATPFEPDAVIKSGQALLAFGTEADQLVPTLKAIGDVSAGLGIPLEEMASIFGKVRVQGRLFTEDINQLQGRGIPVMDELAKVFGKTTAEVREMVSAGDVGFSDLQRVFVNLTGEGGRFFGLMQKQSTTTAGLFSTLKGELTLALQAIGAQILETFNVGEVIGRGIALLKLFREKGLGFVEQGLAALPGIFFKFVDAVQVGISFVVDKFLFFMTIQREMASGFLELVKTIISVGQYLPGLKDDVFEISLAIGFMQNALEESGKSAAAFGEALREEKFSDRIKGLWDKIGKAVGDATDGAEGFGDAMKIVETDVATVAEDIKAVSDEMDKQAMQRAAALPGALEVEDAASRPGAASLAQNHLDEIATNTEKDAETNRRILEEDRKTYRLLENRLTAPQLVTIV